MLAVLPSLEQVPCGDVHTAGGKYLVPPDVHPGFLLGFSWKKPEQGMWMDSFPIDPLPWALEWPRPKSVPTPCKSAAHKMPLSARGYRNWHALITAVWWFSTFIKAKGRMASLMPGHKSSVTHAVKLLWLFLHQGDELWTISVLDAGFGPGQGP